MVKKIRKHFRTIYSIKKPLPKESLHTQNGNVPLNRARIDRISFSVLRNEKNHLRKIENVSYEISIDTRWEWVVRYDDHGGIGFLHRHFRVSIKDNSDVESTAGIKKYKNKDYELTWACNDIKRNYSKYKSKFLKNNGLDLY